MLKLQMIPDDLLDQLNKLKYLERATSQMKEFNDQVTESKNQYYYKRILGIDFF